MSQREIVRSGADVVEVLARGGYGARGLVFLIIGGFAFRAAYASGRAMDSKDALQEIFGSPFGTITLAVLAVALTAFVIWRIAQSLFDADHHGTDVKALAIRAGLFASAVTYGALALWTVKHVIGLASSSDGGSSEGFITKAYEAGFGQAATYLAGAVVACVGLAIIVKGIKAGFLKYMSLPNAHSSWIVPICRIGLIARGITFLVIAFLFVRGAASYSSGETPGLSAALEAIASWPFGWALLSAMGLGLIAFGIYGIVEAFFRRVELDD
ncbi:DUF1206 domain-containing protein [Consotaella salsifontis]|uniref:DUF1206 domain-containing protein n=1 Tax=Consotaella salsifontis TaxID=1365950 RepID=A0A1T4RC22_9HYPH|nr:DUF1206 domain-containing protein [Consotaella salsifontis]SKA13268.1 protein of unknown function [Consotaella salsifontis]